MRPKPRSTMPPSTACAGCIMPITCCSNMSRNCSGFALTNGAPVAVPALATRMSTGPRAATACLHAAVHSFRVGDVGDHVARRLALPHHLGERLFAAACDGDGGAGLRQRCRNGAADAASAAGHKCVLSLKRTHFRSTRCCGETCEFQPSGLLCGNYFRLKLFRFQVSWSFGYAEEFSAVIPGRSRSERARNPVAGLDLATGFRVRAFGAPRNDAWTSPRRRT